MTDSKKSVALVASTQAEIPLIARKVENRLVHQRAIDGYFNATAMCQAAGKRFTDYSRIGPTKRFLSALESEVSIPTSGLVQHVNNMLGVVCPIFRALGCTRMLLSTWPCGCHPSLPFR